MDKILIGKITSPVGLKGEVKVYNYSDRTQIYEETEVFYLGDEPRKLERFRTQKNMLVIKFEGVETREAAEDLRNREVFVTRDDLPELEEGEYYLRDLIGMEVFQDEELIGKVADVITNTSQDILKVETAEGREALIPVVDPIVESIDTDKKIITVDLPEGLLDL